MRSKKPAKRSIYLLGKAARFISLKLIEPLSFTGITPNHITLLSLAACSASAVCYAFGTVSFNLIGVLLFWAFIVFDHMDGDLARFKGMESPAGDFIDSLAGKLAFVFIFAGICFGLAKTYDAKAVWAVGFAVAGGLFAMQSMMFKRQLIESAVSFQKGEYGAEKKNETQTKKVSLLRLCVRELTAVYIGVCYLIIIGSLTNKLYYTLWLSAIYLWLSYVYETTKTIKQLNSAAQAAQ